MKTVISSPDAPAALGPYSQGIALSNVGNLVFFSGQIPLLPDGSMVDGDVTAQTEQVFANIKALLAAAGSDLSKVVKATVFLADMNHFAEMNAVYNAHMPQPYPARSTVQVARLPKDALVEIEVLAYI